ncbi:superoxide dismutase family protein [Morganella morganii]|uniref:superoxide dismutase family protein n=1 Tax=Morganella morganii TaxID=582 RepID=UPI0011403261|nr:superoxide dismutase family protein [Morganella morganii]MBS5193269.1 superoxide dismutase family protein [Morganella morganii]TPW57929.1 superoxide dismutase [Cu-Zn] SodC2 [Morganella morganii]HDU8581775.1 superoxide dismutase family protein [Morganella morganii]
MMKKLIPLLILMGASTSLAATERVTLHEATEKGAGKVIGTIDIQETDYGLLFTPALNGLPPGVHGFHIHENPSCDAAEKEGKPVAALAAGGHFDPAGTKVHAGPYADGHLGDLPVLYVTDDGKATTQVLAPRLKKLSEIKGHAIMVHAGGDNHSDSPAPLGGGGARIACGVIAAE